MVISHNSYRTGKTLSPFTLIGLLISLASALMSSLLCLWGKVTLAILSSLTHFPQLRNAATSQCLDTMGHPAPSLMGIAHCHGFGNNQVCELIVFQF